MKKKAKRTGTTRTERELPLRIIVKSPTPGVLFCVQGKPGEFFSQTRSTGADLVFDVAVRAAPSADGKMARLLGTVAQGPPTQRFIYICSGTYAGEKDTCWARRAKVSLAGITSALIAKRKPGARLTATIHGTAGDGGPVCASVKPLGAGWWWMS